MIRQLIFVCLMVIPVLVGYAVMDHISRFSQVCVDDPAIKILSHDESQKDDQQHKGSHSIVENPCQLFSESYKEATDRFRKAAQRIPGTQLYALPVSSPEETIEIAVLPGDLPGLVIHSSGTHGVEGYAGSAIQIAFMELYAKDDSNFERRQRASHPTMIFLHAVNPWAMKWFRRTNENNVDLNRNALTVEQWIQKAPNHVNHANYAKFEAFFNPSDPPTNFWKHCKVWLHGLMLVLKHGFPPLKAAMTGGQYYNPKGLFYGGSGKLESSWRVLEEWMTTFLETQPKNQVVTWIDVHTGLGDLGVDTFLFDPKAYGTAEKVQEIVKDVTLHFPDTHTPLAGLSQHAAEVMQGYEETMGFSTSYFLKLFADEQKALLGAQEFGTVNNVLVAHALVTENAARQYLSAPEGLVWAKATTKRAFYPDSIEWRKQVLTRGLRLLRQAISRSLSLSHS